MWKHMAVSAVMVTAVVIALLLCISPGEVESVCAEMSSHVSSRVSRWLNIGSDSGGKAAEEIKGQIPTVLPVLPPIQARTVRRLDGDPPPHAEAQASQQAAWFNDDQRLGGGDRPARRFVLHQEKTKRVHEGRDDGGSPGGGGPADGQPKIESDRERIPGIDLKIAGLMEAGILSIAFMMLRTWRREQAAVKRRHFMARLEKSLTGS
jgi:hypothetical protein